MLKNKWIKLGLKILVSLFFVWWIIFKINWEDVFFYLKKISFWGIAIYIGIYFLGIFFSAYKWRFLATHKGINLPLKDYFKAYFTGTFINNFMPSFIGGDSYKVYNIGKLSQKYKQSASSVIMDRLTGLWGGMILAFIFSLCNLKDILENNILFILSIINFGILIFSLGFLEFYKKREIKIPIDNLDKFFNKLLREVAYYNNDARVIWKAIGLSFLFNLTGLALANYIIFWSLGISVGVLDYLSVIFLVSIISSIPISINNIGVKEWAYITFFGFFGIASGAVISVAIVSRLIQMLLSFLAIGFYFDSRKT
ncbi:MAG: lysylphosphatidylglycerol synthase transmembrane domain-containing protein [Parcubacteria group bacterium]|jgi:hypothetical protein